MYEVFEYVRLLSGKLRNNMIILYIWNLELVNVSKESSITFSRV